MNKNISIKFLLFLFVFIYSCKVQEQNNPREQAPQATKSTPSPTIENNWAKEKEDPYFIETNSVETTYGPKSITRNMLQDKKGNIWLATWEGIMKYDGETFTNYTNKDTLSRFHVFSLLEDSKGNLWFGSIGGGVFFYDGESFINFTTQDGLVHNSIGCIYEDKSGTIWIGTQGGISWYDGTSFRNFTTDDGLLDNDINSIIEDRDGKVWIGARGEACTYDGHTFSIITRADGSSFGNVRCIIKDQKGNMWLGGNGGLWCYDGTTFTNFAKTFVGYIFEDRKGDIWTSSEGVGNWNLIRYQVENLTDETPTSTQIEPFAGMLFGIMEDTDGKIWFGSVKGVGRYDGKDFEYFRGEMADE